MNTQLVEMMKQLKVIACFLLLVCASSVVWAQTATPTPTSTPSSTGTPTPTSTSTGTPTATPIPSIENAIDQPGWSFYLFSSGTNWFSQTATTHDGSDAAQSGEIADKGFAIMETTVQGPGNVGFGWKVSSEPIVDALYFVVDGWMVLQSISGTQDWTHASHLVPSGTHTLTWLYLKNESLSRGRDCCWVDQIEWDPIPTPPVWFAPEGLLFAAGSGAHPDVLDLKQYVSDDTTPVSNLLFSLVSQSNPAVVQVSVTPSGLLSATVQGNAQGINVIVIAAQDAQANTSQTTLQVVVGGATGIPPGSWQRLR